VDRETADEEALRQSVERLPAVASALAVEAGCRFLFVVLRPGGHLDPATRMEVQRRCRAAMGRHADAVYVAPDLPRASDGTTLPAAVRRMLAGHPAARVTADEAVSNPAALSFFAFLFANL
jgi:acyl-coenzyme A synthetase/AMP-(fatty) acid ligase